MKRVCLTLLGVAGIVMQAKSQNLQTVTDTGNVSSRDNANIVLQNKTAGLPPLYLQFNYSTGERRGYLGYGGPGNNNFYIRSDNNSFISLQNRTLINILTDDGVSGLQVKDGLAIHGSTNNSGNHLLFRRSDGAAEMARLGWEDEDAVNSPFLIKSSNGNNLLFRINTTDVLTLAISGNAGLGTTTPLARLDVRGNLILDAGADPHLFTGSTNAEQNRFLRLLNSPSVLSASGLKAGGILISDNYSFANPGKNDLVVKGNVAIGSASAGTYKLAVNGTIGARRIKVTQENPWADFVFEDNYPLLSLPETAAFIRQHKHLPGIPTTAEVNKDGVDLGEMNTKLLQKVEELTLHLIEHDKRMAALEKELKALKQQQ